MSDIDFDQLKKNLSDLNHTIDLRHLKNMIRDIAEAKTQEVDLRNSPLHKYSPAQVCELLEELN